MSDLVKRLREKSGQYDPYDWHSEIEIDAADRIEQLERENAELEDQLACATNWDQQKVNPLTDLSKDTQ